MTQSQPIIASYGRGYKKFTVWFHTLEILAILVVFHAIYVISNTWNDDA